MEVSGAKVRRKAEAKAKAEEMAESPQFLLILGESASWQKKEKKQLKRQRLRPVSLKPSGTILRPFGSFWYLYWR
jgi:hypothetical protein